MISVCITNKDRIELETDDGIILQPLVKCINSIIEYGSEFVSEIIIADFKSDKIAQLDEKLYIDPNIEIKKITVNGKFSRGKGRNISYRHSTKDVIFFVDADMYFTSSHIFEFGYNISLDGAAFFPICYSYYNHQNKDGWWRTTGFGNLLIRRDIFNKYGWWKEKYSWGGEDDEIYLKLSRNVPVIRTYCPGFFHLWHPESIDIPNKKRRFWLWR